MCIRETYYSVLRNSYQTLLYKILCSLCFFFFFWMHVVAQTTAFQCLSHGVYLWRGIQRQSFMVSAAEVIVLLKVKTRACFLCSAGVVSRTAGLALQDRWGLDRSALLTLESRWTSHSQHHWVPCKCEVGVRMVTRIHALRSVFMHKLVWFQLLLARKEGESENSQTPEPSLTTPAPPLHPQDTCIRPDFIAVFLLASCHTRCWRTSPTQVEHPGLLLF